MKRTNLGTPKVESLNDLFSKENSFVIPAYQRPYEWKKEQVEQLLENLCEAFEKKAEDIYLLGTLQFNVLPEDNSLTKKLEVIDGHQRITTLYLLLRYWNKAPQFGYKNEIDNAYETIEDYCENDNKYKENYNYIVNFFLKDDSKKDYKKIYENQDKFIKYLLKNVLFISISIEDNTSIDDTLKIFDTLNTTGLNLQVKDVFKIKFSDHLARFNGFVDKSETIRRINEAYENVTNPIDYGENEKEERYDSIYNLEETDLLDAYRFYLMSQIKTEDHHYNTEFKQSNLAFFEDIFDSNEPDYKLSIEDFCNLSTCIKKTQNYLRERDLKKAETLDDLVLGCSRELLDWSGYSRIKNLYYYVAFVAYISNDKKVDDRVIRLADSVTNSIWRFCSIFRLVRAKVVNDVFNEIGNALYKNNGVITDISDAVEEYLVFVIKNYIQQNYYEKFVGFKELLNKNSNIFECNKPELFVFLSYIDDAFEVNDRTIVNTKGKIGHWLFNHNKGLDVEHILSRSLYNEIEQPVINSIGNLMYLPASINRYLGKELKKYKDNNNAKELDFNKKIEGYQKDNEELACVKRFLRDYQTNIDFIDDRSNKKIKFLKDVYKYETLFNEG